MSAQGKKLNVQNDLSAYVKFMMHCMRYVVVVVVVNRLYWAILTNYLEFSITLSSEASKVDSHRLNWLFDCDVKIVCHVFSIRFNQTLKETAVNANNFGVYVMVNLAPSPILIIITVMVITHLHSDHDIQNWLNHFLLSEYFKSKKRNESKELNLRMNTRVLFPSSVWVLDLITKIRQMWIIE